MAIQHAKSGEVFGVRPSRSNQGVEKTTTLVKTPVLEVLRLVFQSGKEVCHHHAMAGEVILQCLEGRIDVQVGSDSRTLQPDQRVYLAAGAPHAIRGISDASALLTILLPGPGGHPKAETPSSPPMPFPGSQPIISLDVPPLDGVPAELQMTTVLKTPTLEVRRLVLPKGREVPAHRASGEITVHCLEGRVAFTAGGETRNLEANQALFLHAEVPHSLVGLEASSLLVTKQLPVRPAGG
jgi:quercetin dioxygenase-like cupin family protein